MLFFNKVDRTYQLETKIPKDTLITNLRLLIENARKDTKWISFANVDYKRVDLEADKLTIDREGLINNSLKGRGIITAVFEQTNDNGTIVKAEIKPLVIVPIICFYTCILILLSFYALCGVPQWPKLFGILIGLAATYGIAKLTITIQRWRLESYLESILADLGIKEEMIENI
jgi:hypothetical protein